jgi:hypothetical protein
MSEPIQPNQVSARLRKAVMAATACVLFSNSPTANATQPAQSPAPSDATVAQRIAQVRAKADAQRSAAAPNAGHATLNNLGWFGNWPNHFANFPNWGKWGKWHNHFHNF